MKQVNEIIEILRSKKLRITQARLIVAQFMVANKDLFFSSDEIYHQISKSKKTSCDRTSIYRTLNKFAEIGLVVKSDFYGEASKYQLHNDFMKDNHQHFFKCIDCDKVETIRNCLILSKQREMEKLGYSKLGHHLEIKGLCPDCTLSI